MPLLLFDSHRYPGIFIDDASAGFFGPVAIALRDLSRLQIGHDLLTIISKRTRGIGISGQPLAADRQFRMNRMKEFKCVIRRGPGTLVDDRMQRTSAYRSSRPDVALAEDLSNLPAIALRADVTTRRSTNGHVTLPGRGVSAVAMVEPMANYTQFLDGIPTPLYVALGHELIHCMHFLSGDTTIYGDDDPWGAKDSYTKHEEARTVGLGIYAGTRISENAIRREAKLKERAYYNDPGDCDKLTSGLRLPPPRAAT